MQYAFSEIDIIFCTWPNLSQGHKACGILARFLRVLGRFRILSVQFNLVIQFFIMCYVLVTSKYSFVETKGKIATMILRQPKVLVILFVI